MVCRALDAAAEQLRQEAKDAETQNVEEASPARRRADALGLLAESALAATLDPGTAGDRYQVVVHVDPETLRENVSAETSRRLACDAGKVLMRHDAAGAILDVGRKTRTISPALRRALASRDRHCHCPGCEHVPVRLLWRLPLANVRGIMTCCDRLRHGRGRFA